MIHFFPSGIRSQNPDYLKKKKNILITLYGPYGDFKYDMEQICKTIREKYGYNNCKLVSEREEEYTSLVKDQDILMRDKSFYFLEKSHVSIFVFFCDKNDKSKISHGESASAELTHLVDSLKSKIKCCFVLIEKGCPIGQVVLGQVKGFDIMYETSNFEDHEEIAKLIQARCITFLMKKYYEIT